MVIKSLMILHLSLQNDSCGACGYDLDSVFEWFVLSLFFICILIDKKAKFCLQSIACFVQSAHDPILCMNDFITV